MLRLTAARIIEVSTTAELTYGYDDSNSVSGFPLEVGRRFSDPIRLESGCNNARPYMSS